MRKKKLVTRAAVLREMMALATHPVNDAVRLAYFSEDCHEEIAQLDLTGLNEFKRNANGTVEIKLTDRMRVLEAIADRLDEEQTQTAASFLQALEAPNLSEDPQISRR